MPVPPEIEEPQRQRRQDAEPDEVSLRELASTFVVKGNFTYGGNACQQGGVGRLALERTNARHPEEQAVSA